MVMSKLEVFAYILTMLKIGFNEKLGQGLSVSLSSRFPDDLRYDKTSARAGDHMARKGRV